MERGGDDEAYYRQRTVARLIDKRRQMEEEEQKEAEAKKLEELKFRVQWKEGFKKKRAEMISNKIDKAIMQKTLRRNPEMLVQLMNMEKYGVAECKEEETLAELVEGYDEGDAGVGGSPGLHTASSFNRGNILTAPRSLQALKFLQNAATFHLSVNKRLKEQQQQLGNPSQSLIKSPVGAGSDPSRRSTLQPEDILSVFNGNNNLKSEGRLFSSYRNESKVNSLVLQLLDDAPAHSVQGNTKDTRPRGSSTAAENSLFQQLVNRRIKTVGLMSHVIRYSHLAPPGMGNPPLERTNSFSIHRSSNLTPASRMLASSSRSVSNFHSNNKDSSSTTGANGSINSHSHSNNSDDASRAAQTAALDTALTGTDAMFCSLVDSIFLIGPSAQSILDQIAAHTVVMPQEPVEKDKEKEAALMRRSTSQAQFKDGISPNAPSSGTNSTATTTTTTVPDFNAVLPSTMLFVTENHCPPEMAMLLPAYCYPSGVELGVRSTKSPQASANSNGKRRKNSLNLLTQKILTEPTTTTAAEGKNTKRKSTIFFPSDFAINANGNGANNGTAGTGTNSNTGSKENATITEPSVPPVNVHMPNRNQFILLLGDHTYQQYGVCVQLPRQFTTESGLVIHTSYVLCMMTKFPLFNYLYHILDQYDAVFDGLKFKNFIPTQDVNYPFVAELKPLSDLAAKLKRLLVPKYPYIINMNAPVPTGRSRARTSTDISVMSPVNNSTDKRNEASDPDYLALDASAADSDIKAILPDIEFGYGSGLHAGGKKLTALFKRSAYQSYFSTAGAKYDPFNKNVSELIGRYDKMVQDFVPNALHKAEKECEDSFLVMLWALPVLLKYLPLDQIILALGCAITEMKIIVMHPDHHVISSVILALMQLLRPLRWCPPVIVILPDQYQEIIESPTPVMIGMPRLPEHFTLIEGFVVIDPQERIVHLNPIDVVESHTILLPHGSKLVNALSASAETILKCTKKKRNARSRKSTPGPGTDALPGESLVDQLLLNTTANAASHVPLAVPLPVELDLNSYENLQLLAAVKTFMGIVSNHIQAILNTAIQMQQQSKKASQDQRRLLIKSGSLPRTALGSSKKKTVSAVAASAAPVNANTTTNNNNNAISAVNANNNTISNNNMTVSTSTTATASNTTPTKELDRPESSMYISAPGSAETSSNSIPRPPSLTMQTSPTHAAPPKQTTSTSEHNALSKSTTDLPLNLNLPADKNTSPAAVTSARRSESTFSPRGVPSAKNKAPFKPSPKQTAPAKRKDGRLSELGMRPLEPAEAAPTVTSATGAPPSKLLRKTSGSRHSLSGPLVALKKDAEEKDEHTPLVSPRNPATAKTTKTRQSLSKEPSFTFGGAGSSNNVTAGRKLTPKNSDMSLGIAGKNSRKSVEDNNVKAPLSAKGAPLDPHSSFHTTQANSADLLPHQSTNDLKTLQDPSVATKGTEPGPDEKAPLSLDVADNKDALPTPPLTHIHSMRHNSSNALVFTLDSLMSPMVYPSQKKSSFMMDKPEGITDISLPAPATNTATTSLEGRNHPSAASPTFDNLPSKADLFADDEPRDSLNDETCSEITVTDAGGHHRGEEESLVGRVQETSSNDSGDKLSDINESVCSDASSLPSLKSNAPLLLVREIGQSGAKFIDKIQETQMYSNYCNYVKTQSAQAAAKLVADAAAALAAGPASGFAGRGRATSRALTALLQSTSHDQDVSTTPRSRKNTAWSQLLGGAEDVEYTGDTSEEEEEELALDSLQEVFSILLTGTVEMKETFLDTLYAKYDDLYAETSVVDVQALRTKYANEFTKAEKVKDLDAVFHEAIQKFHATSAAPLAKPPVDLTSLEPVYETKCDPEGVDPSVSWCNGLLCGGMCNTAYCTEICLSLWEHKVKRIRRQAVFKSILMKRHHPSSTATMTTSSTALRPGVFSPDQKASRLSLSLAIVPPKVEVVKHHKETQSQFEQRKAIAENRKLEGLRSLYPEVGKLSHLKGTQKSIYGPAQGGKKRLLYARGSTSDPATLAIAKHYAMKQRKVQNTQIRKAMRVIKPLMLRFVCLYRRYKFFHAIYTIQALIRGFYVRNHIPELVEALIARRIRRFLACLRIRRFLRQNADQIYRRHVRIKMEEQRRRRATLSIPVKSANDVHRPNSPKQQRTPRRIYSLSDDILPTSGIKIAGLGGSPTPPASIPTSSAPSGTESTKQSTEDVAQLTSEKAVLDLAAGVVNDSEKAPPSSTDVDASNNATVGAGGGSTKEGSSTRSPRYSTGTYTDRVKEYLQFGKVTHRNSVAAMPQTNKYAAHYMQKRNSKNAKDLVGILGNSPPAVGTRKELPTTVTSGSPPEKEAVTSAAPEAVPEAENQQASFAPEEDHSKPLWHELSSGDSEDPPSDQRNESTAGATEGGVEVTGESEQIKKLRRDLYISTRFASEDSGETRSTISGGSYLGSPASAFTSVNKERTAGIEEGANESVDGDEQNLPPPVDLSPTSGIRTYHNVEYTDSDEENAGGNSLRFSDLRASDILKTKDTDGGDRKTNSNGNSDENLNNNSNSSPTASSQHSLLAINLVEGSLKHPESPSAMKFNSIEEYHQYNKSSLSITAHAPSEEHEDDRASVLSSNSNSTTPQRRLSSTASTDAESTQPVLLSILGLHSRPSMHTVLSGSTESAISVEKNEINPQDAPEHTINRVMSMSADDLASVASVNSTYSRNGQRGSFGSINSLAVRGNGSKQATSLAEDQQKKFSPIGRYTAEKSYDVKRLFSSSSRNPAAPFSRVPFKPAEGSEVQSLSEEMDFAKGADNSPMKSSPLFNPARVAPRVGLLGGPSDSSRYTRRQASLMSSGAASLTSRRLSASSENMNASGDLKGRPGMFRVQSDRVADINSLSRDTTTYGPSKGKFGEEGGWSPRRAGMQRYASQGTTVQNNLGIGWEDYDNSAIVSDSLTYSGLHSNSVQEENPNPIQYHRHVRPNTPTKRDIANTDNSPIRSSGDGRLAVDAELPLPVPSRTRKADSVSFEPAVTAGTGRTPRPSVNFERPLSVNELERVEGYGGFGDDVEDDEEDDLEFTPLDDIQEAIKVAPLKTLGSNVHEFISRQQLHTVLDMWRLLRAGIEVLKHSRRGGPKFKTLLCDVNLTKLYWRSAGSKADPDQDDLPDDLRYYPTLLDSSAGSAELAHGMSPIEFMPTSNTSRMGRTHFGAKSNADRVLYIRDILAVRDDCSTEVMQRSLHKKYVTLNRTSVISIILSDRTLDFEIEEEPWNALFRALQILVNFYQVIVPGPRMTMTSTSGRPSGFSNFLTYDTTGPSLPSDENSGKELYGSSSGPGTQSDTSARKRHNSSSLGGFLSRRSSGRSDQQEGAPLL